MAKNQIEPHSLEDIRAVRMRPETYNVNHRGSQIGLPMRDKNAQWEGWICLRCNVEFRQWAAVLVHVHDMQEKENQVQQRTLSATQSTAKAGRKRNRVHIIPVETVTDIVRFSRDVLDLKISETMARAVAVLLRNPTEIRHVSQARSRAMRIAAEYKAVKL